MLTECFSLVDGKNSDAWSANLKSGDYELLCPSGGRAPVDQFERCNLAQVPPHMVSLFKQLYVSKVYNVTTYQDL